MHDVHNDDPLPPLSVHLDPRIHDRIPSAKLFPGDNRRLFLPLSFMSCSRRFINIVSAGFFVDKDEKEEEEVVAAVAEKVEEGGGL